MAEEVKAKNIGLDARAPGARCDDRKCPFHGSVGVRGALIEGTVVSSRMTRTVVVQIDYVHYVPKYKRYERRRSKIPAHNPPCVGAKIGDKVKIGETRPLSKTVHFVVVERVIT
ncbi:MAG: 30S ribosomal protein S17 [Candidatus Bathyarchaeia archaeon]